MRVICILVMGHLCSLHLCRLLALSCQKAYNRTPHEYMTFHMKLISSHWEGGETRESNKEVKARCLSLIQRKALVCEG